MKFSKFIKRTTLNNRCQRRRCFKSIAILACSQCSLGLGGTMKPLVEFRVKNPGNSSYLKVFINARKKLIVDYSLPRQYFKISKLQLRKLPCKIIEWCRNLYFKNQLTILTGKNCVLLNSVQGMAGWLLLTFFVCLQNQLSCISLTMRLIKWTVKMTGCSFQQVLRQNLGWFLS